jgi:hypothetical protein
MYHSLFCSRNPLVCSSFRTSRRTLNFSHSRGATRPRTLTSHNRHNILLQGIPNLFGYMFRPRWTVKSRDTCAQQNGQTLPLTPTMTMASVVHVALLILLSYFLFASYRKFVRHPVLPLPLPGPKPWPLFGNITDLRRKELWLLASDWAKRYGQLLPILLLMILSESNSSQATLYTCTSSARVSSS